MKINKKKTDYFFLKFRNSIVFIFIILLLTECTNKTNGIQDFGNDISVLEKKIKKDMDIFVKYDSLNYQSDYVYIKANNICTLADNIIKSHSENSLVLDSLQNFIKTVNIVCNTTENTKLQIDNYQDLNKSLFLFKVRLYQHLAVNYYVTKYQNNYYPFQWVKPIVVPRKNEIHLGEEFIADIYLTGIDKNNVFIAISDKNDTLKSIEDPYVPVLRENPKSKGKKEINGYLQFYHPIFGIKKYDYHYEYMVK